MTLNAYPGIDFNSTELDRMLRQLVARLNNMLKGKVNAAVEFTPAAATTSTVINDDRITPNSVFYIEPTSSNGAVELAAGTMFIAAANRGARTCTVTHSTGAGNELFRLLILS